MTTQVTGITSVTAVAILIMTPACAPKPLLEIVRSRRYLLEHPLQWTSRHLEAVGCRFDDIGTPACLESTHQDREDTERGQSSDAEALARSLFPNVKLRCLFNILLGEGRGFACVRKGSHFCFQGRAVHQPDYIVFRRHEPPSNNILPPTVGYIHYTNINGDRRELFERRSRATRAVDPIGEYGRFLLVTPQEWTDDPYFLCILLALGQSQHRHDSSQTTAYITHLLVTHVLDRDSILLCEAEITTDLLNALKNLKTARTPVKWPSIRRKKIPYKPYNTFADRLLGELVTSGPSNAADHANYACSNKTKRRHEEEDGEDDSGSRKVPRILGT
ncbi:hypothetical protein BJY00DRAFT_289064 [Aspergillus carlsbadensis]|nr:hypothetical protein BJY00DRAFT_289064 [Aspergillus carlsbadensis]